MTNREWITREEAERWWQDLKEDMRAVMEDRIPEVAAEIVAAPPNGDERRRILAKWVQERQERLARLVADYQQRLGDPPKVQ
jgi:hypothetical protein